VLPVKSYLTSWKFPFVHKFSSMHIYATVVILNFCYCRALCVFFVLSWTIKFFACLAAWLLLLKKKSWLNFGRFGLRLSHLLLAGNDTWRGGCMYSTGCSLIYHWNTENTDRHRRLLQDRSWTCSQYCKCSWNCQVCWCRRGTSRWTEYTHQCLHERPLINTGDSRYT